MMCEWLEGNNDGELVTVGELRQKMIGMVGEDAVYKTRTIKEQLKAKYGDHVLFTSSRGRTDVICLRDMASFILHEKWQSDRQQNVHDESIRVVSSAADLIINDIKEKQYMTDTYPTTTEISDTDNLKDWIPPLLLLLMEKIIPDEVKRLALCNAIVQAARPCSCISPVLFGVAVEMDHTFGSKWLVTELARLGFSLSYDEVVRYKHSVLQDNSGMLREIDSYPQTFTQFAADNVDHNVATLDGKGTFHGMGIVAISTRSDNTAAEVKRVAVKRVKKRCVTDVVCNKGITVHQYHVREKHGLTELSFHPLHSLTNAYVLPSMMNLDILWSSGWLFPDAARPKSNWSGFMQHVSTGEHSSVSQVSLLPIIDLNPSDLTCIHSTLVFVEEQAKHLNIATPCVTFDQPLWIKAVDVVRAANLNVVCRLGGFHTIMSFLGSVGSVMNGSGLSDVLETVYGPNVVVHMLHGKAVARALRGNFLVDAALTVLIPQFTDISHICCECVFVQTQQWCVVV